MHNFLKENEVLDTLGIEDYKIIQHTKKYKFTSDAVLLANFAKIKKTHIVADLCSGSGIVGILCNIKYQPKHTYMVEMQEYMAEMSQRSIKMNNLKNITVINKKIQEITEIQPETCDVITINPPYKKAGIGAKNITEEIALSRHEIEIDLTDIAKCSSKLLKFGGKLYMVHDANRLTEIISTFKKHNLEVKKILLTYANINNNANLVLIQATKGGKSGVEVCPVLITNNADGTYNHDLLKYIK